MFDTEISKYIRSNKGDELQVSLIPLRDQFLSQEAHERLSRDGVDVLMVELDRVKGIAPVGHLVLSNIEQVVADAFVHKRNTVICFICDFLSPIPSSKKQIPCQQYRSILFTRMFERYISKHESVMDMTQTVVAIEGTCETYYVHLIARKEQMHYVQLLSEDIKTGFSK